MTTFFRPSDITTHTCAVNNLTRGGSAFAVTEGGEHVFIPPKIVDLMGIDVGDMLTAYCIDNFRDENGGEQKYAVRWRAIRVAVQERFMPKADAPVAAVPVTLAAPVAPVEMTAAEVHAKARDLLLADRAWTTVQLAEEIGCDSQRISSWLHAEHKEGRVAAARIFARGEQDKPSRSYYARDVQILYELIDEIVLHD